MITRFYEKSKSIVVFSSLMYVDFVTIYQEPTRRNDLYLETSKKYFWCSQWLSGIIIRRNFFPLSVLSVYRTMKSGFLVMKGETLTGDDYKMCSYWKSFHTKELWSKCSWVCQDGGYNGCLFTLQISMIIPIKFLNPVILWVTSISVHPCIFLDLHRMWYVYVCKWQTRDTGHSS